MGQGAQTMKIDNTGKPLGAVNARGDARAAKSESRESAATAEAQPDSVDIKSFSARLATLEATLSTQPAVDEAKVAEIRKAISEGRFSVQAEAIADRLIASVKEL